MNVGLDIGYAAVKMVSGARRATFPSVVGSPDRPAFALGGEAAIWLQEPGPALVGQEAVEQSRFLRRREDRKWILSEEWYTLAMAALSELTPASAVELVLVAGLPSAFYSDRDAVTARLLTAHRVRRQERHAQVLRVTSCRVIPQPFGTVLSACLDDNGRIADKALATGNVGVIDVGGKTTNVLSVRSLREVARETASVTVGAWDAVRAVRQWLAEQCPDLELRDHEIAAAIQAREVRYFGTRVDLGPAVDAALAPMAEQVIAQASQMWNGAARLDCILVSGGGAHLLGPYIGRHFRHARTVAEPVIANALGFWRFAQRLAGL